MEQVTDPISTKERERAQEQIEVCKTRLRFSRAISDNAKREQEALLGYYQLKDELTPWLYDDMLADDPMLVKFKEDIDEIISDELNHAAKLQSWAIKLGGVPEARS